LLRFRIRIICGKLDLDPHQSRKQDPHPHDSEKQDPDPHQSEKQDPDPHQRDEDLRNTAVDASYFCYIKFQNNILLLCGKSDVFEIKKNNTDPMLFCNYGSSPIGLR
jgi:hypothetical protein